MWRGVRTKLATEATSKTRQRQTPFGSFRTSGSLRVSGPKLLGTDLGTVSPATVKLANKLRGKNDT